MRIALALALASIAVAKPSQPAAETPDCTHVLNRSKHMLGTSPFVLLNHIAMLAAGRRFAEIGSQSGDLIECVSHYSAPNAVSIEADSTFCKGLRQRAAHSNGRWRSLCPSFFSGKMQEGVPDADLFFSWFPHYFNPSALLSFAELQDRGDIRHLARYALAFDSSTHQSKEIRCWKRMRPFELTHTSLEFYEGASNRQHGRFIVAEYNPVTINFSALAASVANVCIKGGLSCANGTTFGGLALGGAKLARQ